MPAKDSDDRIEIRLAGEGGQGMILAGIILAEAAAIYDGKNAVQTQSYGPEARGGASKAEVIISEDKIDFPEVISADVLLVLSQEACDKYASNLKKTGVLIVDADQVGRIPVTSAVKLPITREGVQVCARFAEEGIATNLTLCFSPAQALLVAKAGASYVSPFVGRLDDVGSDGMQLVREMVQIYDTYEFPTQVLVASVRHPQHVVEAALAGADVATVPFKVLAQLYQHPLTDVGLQRFIADYRAAKDVH